MLRFKQCSDSKAFWLVELDYWPSVPSATVIELNYSLRGVHMSSCSPLLISLGPVAACSQGGGQECRLAVAGDVGQRRWIPAPACSIAE